MPKLVLHPATQKLVDDYLANPTHALCLVGPPGAGKGYLAKTLVRTVLGTDAADSMLLLSAAESGLGIEQVRELQHFLRLKKPGNNGLKRAVIIEDAERMSEEAQNALLKTLEEPPADTIFILTTDGSASLRPTIYSRVQKLPILPVPLDTAKEFFTATDTEIAKAYSLSGGYAGLMYALLNDPEHALVKAVGQAKEIMQATTFERLSMVDRLAKEKDNLPTLFYALQRVVGAVMARSKDRKQLKRMVATSRALYQAEADLTRSVNSKLLLTDLFLQL